MRANREAELWRYDLDRGYGVDSDWIDARYGRDGDQYQEEGTLPQQRQECT